MPRPPAAPLRHHCAPASCPAASAPHRPPPHPPAFMGDAGRQEQERPRRGERGCAETHSAASGDALTPFKDPERSRNGCCDAGCGGGSGSPGNFASSTSRPKQATPPSSGDGLSRAAELGGGPLPPRRAGLPAAAWPAPPPRRLQPDPRRAAAAACAATGPAPASTGCPAGPPARAQPARGRTMARRVATACQNALDHQPRKPISPQRALHQRTHTCAPGKSPNAS